jgi:hypothetical protein
VIDAAESLLLVAAIEERGPAVRAVVLDEADLAGGDAEGDQVLAQQADTHRRAIRLGQLTGEQDGDPVLPDEVPHRRAGSDATE